MRLKNFYLKPELCRVYRREVLIFRKVENSVKKLAISCGKLVIPRRHFGKSKNRGSAGLAPPDVVEGHQPTQNTAPLTRKKHRFLKIFSRLFHANIRKKIFHRRSRKSKNYEPAGKHSEGVVTEKESANFGVKGICFFVANNQESSDTRIGRGAGARNLRMGILPWGRTRRQGGFSGVKSQTNQDSDFFCTTCALSFFW